MSSVSANLLQAQQLFSAALASGAINAAAYASGSQTLAQVRLDTGDVRDLVRIASPSDVVTKNISFVAAEIGTLPGVLGGTAQLQTSLASLTTSMQASLGQAGKLIASSSCAQAVP